MVMPRHLTFGIHWLHSEAEKLYAGTRQVTQYLPKGDRIKEWSTFSSFVMVTEQGMKRRFSPFSKSLLPSELWKEKATPGQGGIMVSSGHTGQLERQP